MSRSIGGAEFIFMAVALVMFVLPSLANDNGQPTASEGDPTVLKMAQDACAKRDFSGLLEAMARSDAVVRHYSSPKITLASNGKVSKIGRDSYRDFPIALLDYSWVTRASWTAVEKKSNAKIQFLKIEMNQSQQDMWRVDYVLADEEGGSTVPSGKPSGSLLFEPKGNCWELVSDTRD